MTQYENLQYWALCAAFLYFKMMTNAAVQGFVRSKSKTIAVAEDTKVFGASARVTAQPPELLTRASACWRNDLENIPIFLILSAAYVALGAHTACLVTALIVFAAARSVHTFCYLKELQPYRTIAYNVGCLATLAMAILVVAKAIWP